MKVDTKNLSDEKQKPGFGHKVQEKASAKNDPVTGVQEEPSVDSPENDGAIETEETGSTGNVYRDNFNMYKEQYSKKLKNMNLLQNNKFWIGVIVVLFFIFLSVNSNASAAKNQLTIQLNRAINETDKLEIAVAELEIELEEQARISSIVLSNEEEELARNDAKVQGAFVANLQNEFAEAASDPDMYSKMEAIKNKLDGYFSDDAKRIGKGAWYPYLAAGIPGEWSFGSNASFSGDEMEVIWFMYANDPNNPDDHSMLAYCTAVYHASDGLFYNVEVKTTTYAEANSNVNDEEEGYIPNSDELSIMEQLQELANEMETNTPSVDEEYVNEAVSGREEYKDAASGEEDFDERYLPGLGTDSDDERSE